MQPLSPEFKNIRGVIDVFEDYDSSKYKPANSSNNQFNINNIAFKIILNTDFDIRYLVTFTFYSL
jgi:hypothetical protein